VLAKEGGGVAKSAPSTTRLYRAVEPGELADVVKYGDYNIHPNSTFKRFAFDEGSLDDFIKANPGRDYTKTFIDVPTENLGQMYRHADPGGVGRSIGIDVYENPHFYDWFDKVNIIPK
jgi:filamentous hemagglutinin